MGFLQNPVNSIQWLEADLHLLGPLVSLTIDTRLFCQPLFRTKIVLVLAVVFTLFCWAAILIRWGDNTDTFGYYNFLQSFRLEFFGSLLAEAAGYIMVVYGARWLLGVYQRRRLHPASA